MGPENFTTAELAEIGKKALSNNYGGDEYEAFTGSSDASLDFHGQRLNLTEKVKGHVGFRCTLTNKLVDRDLTVVILPAYFINPMIAVAALNSGNILGGNVKGDSSAVDSSTFNIQRLLMQTLAANGVNADIIMLDGKWYSETIVKGEEGEPDTKVYDEIASVVSSLPNKTVAGFIEFCQRNATRIPEILIASNSTDTYTQVMRIRPVSPARDIGEKTIYLGEYFDQKNTRVDYITVPTDNFGVTGLQFDDQTLIMMNIPAATKETPTTVTFTFKFGVSLNNASQLATKAAIAKSDTPVMIQKSMVNIPAIKAALTA